MKVEDRYKAAKTPQSAYKTTTQILNAEKALTLVRKRIECTPTATVSIYGIRRLNNSLVCICRMFLRLIVLLWFVLIAT